MFYVYILQWEYWKYYIWYTANIEERLSQHRNGNTPTTSKMWTLSLIWYFIKETKTEAIRLERMIKKNGHTTYRIDHETFIRC